MHTDGYSKGLTPKYKNVFVGDSITLYCASSTKPMWFFNDNLLVNGVVTSGGYMKIVNATTQHDGQYKCLGRNVHNDKEFMSSSTIKIIGKNISMFRVYSYSPLYRIDIA